MTRTPIASLPRFKVQFPVADEDRVLDGRILAGTVHDDVVDECDVQNPARPNEAGGEQAVFVRRPHVSGRVVVCGDEADGAAHDGVSEHVARPNVDLVDRAFVDDNRASDHFAALVAWKSEEHLLLLSIAKRGENRRRLVRFVDHRPVNVDGQGGPPFIHEFRFHCRVS